ncbi:acyltransferase 3 [Diaporthe sp. PMI_573]|nr:acyltransferase 3 [Diaporthaceae sp. PMI_573]
MLSNLWGGSAPQQRGEQLLPQTRNGAGDSSEHKDGEAKPLDPGKQRDKIKCLDGLRGVACFLVFNYHFLWPWTPLIMLGYGARPPYSPEPFTEWASLPIVCLLHRGRPMVAIFFAISGYVLCRHMLRSMYQGRLDDVRKRLGSAVFRRIFRLYIPPSISMFIVALLVQLGAFKSEDAIYKGGDSIWINGTVTQGFFNETCMTNDTIAVMGTEGVAGALGLQSSSYLNDTIHWNDTLCLNSTSTLYGAAAIYNPENQIKTENFNETEESSWRDKGTLRGLYSYLGYHADGPQSEVPYLNSSFDYGLNTTNTTQNFTWMQLGGMWEEHPIIHPHVFKALANFTVVYSEWANPFNFNHYHPRYDPHTYTIPMELRGSMVLYTLLLGTAALKAKWRLGTAAGLSLYALTLGRWDIGTFVGGMVLSEVDVLRTSDPSEVGPEDRALLHALGGGKGGVRARQMSPLKARAVRWLLILAALWFLSYPDAAAEHTPGFKVLSMLAPRYYPPISRWMYYQALGALLLIPCVLRSPTLRGLLEGSVAQYLGKVSFSFYLVHGPVLHSLGFWIMPRLFELFGRPVGFVMGWFMLLSATLKLVSYWQVIDDWSVTVGRRVEAKLIRS